MMTRVYYFAFTILVFVLGILLTSYFYQFHAPLPEAYPSQLGPNQLFTDAFSLQAKERASPGDHIKDEQIHVFEDGVILDLQNIRWTSFTDTNSMDPLLDETAHGLEYIPEQPGALQIGDVISYRYKDDIIIHRIIEIGSDENGWYAVTKGDNNAAEDPVRVRFSDITGVLVGILY